MLAAILPMLTPPAPPGANCYAWHGEFMAHPEWHVKLDNGTVYLQNGLPILDPTVAAAAKWCACCIHI